MTTHEMSKTHMRGTAQKVLEFWTGLGFTVTYDVMKDGYQCLCHNDGFGVDVMWALVCPSQPTLPPLLPAYARTQHTQKASLYLYNSVSAVQLPLKIEYHEHLLFGS